MSKIFKIIFYSICLFAYSHVMANEESKYDVVKSNNTYEIRKYSDRLAIQVASTSGNNSFRKLFDYISGNNEKNQKIEMTVPVTVTEQSESTIMQFYLPSEFDKNNTPNPISSDVEVITIEGGYYAVIKYSGRSSDKNFLKNKNILEKQLKQDNITIISPPIRASYNSPFTLPMLKRNEIMYKINL